MTVSYPKPLSKPGLKEKKTKNHHQRKKGTVEEKKINNKKRLIDLNKKPAVTQKSNFKFEH